MLILRARGEMLLSAAQSTLLWGGGIKALEKGVVWPSSSSGLYRQSRRLVITNTRSKSGSTFSVRKKNAAREEAEKKFPRTVRSKELVFKIAKGYRGKTVHRIARQRVAKALQYSYRDRRNRKRDFRRLWIQRINAAARLHGFTYDEFIYGLNAQKVQVNRKLLANIAIHSPDVFKKIADALPKKPKEQVPVPA